MDLEQMTDEDFLEAIEILPGESVSLDRAMTPTEQQAEICDIAEKVMGWKWKELNHKEKQGAWYVGNRQVAGPHWNPRENSDDALEVLERLTMLIARPVHADENYWIVRQQKGWTVIMEDANPRMKAPAPGRNFGPATMEIARKWLEARQAIKQVTIHEKN